MKVRKVDNGRYEVDFTYIHPLTGKEKRFRRYSPFTAKRKAQRWGAERLTDHTDRNWWLEKQQREREEKIPTIAEFKEDFIRLIDGGKSHGTVTNYESKLRNHVVPHIGEMRLDQVTTADVDDLLSGLDLADNTIRGVATALGALYTMAVRRELIGKGDRPAIEPPASWGSISEHRETPKYLDDDEVARLVEAAPERIEVMLKFGLRTGLRIGELLGLAWDVIDFQGKQIEIKRQWRRDCADASTPDDLPLPKYGLVRTIPVTEDTLDLLRAHRKTIWSSDTYVFSFRALPDVEPLAPDGVEGSCLEPIHIQRMRSVTKWSFSRAEISSDKVGWHCIRHTFAARLATSGMSLRVLQKLLGHCSVTTTEIYGKLLPQSGDIARAILRENAM